MASNSNTADLRSFIGQIEELGQLRRMEGADWNVEIGAITECVSDKEGPALLFDGIKDYRKGLRILTNVFRTHERFALATPGSRPECMASSYSTSGGRSLGLSRRFQPKK
jgi:UbiD family decarboxylase